MDDIQSIVRDTEKKCPLCGATLKIALINIFGNDQVFPIDCQCVIDKRKREDQERKDAERRRYIADLRHNSGLPLKWDNVTFESFTPCKGAEMAYTKCHNYAEQFGRLQSRGIGMYLMGTKGSGKSMLAASIANKLLESGISVKWWNVTSLYLEIQKSFRSDYTGPDILEGCTRAGLLILDDMGAEKPSEWTMATMYDIINSRIENVLPTIITSNLTFEDLQSKADARVMSRLGDRDIFPIVVNTAKDYRCNHGKS